MGKRKSRKKSKRQAQPLVDAQHVISVLRSEERQDLVILFIPSHDQNNEPLNFCRRMGRETNQAAVGLVVSSVFHEIVDA